MHVQWTGEHLSLAKYVEKFGKYFSLFLSLWHCFPVFHTCIWHIFNWFFLSRAFDCPVNYTFGKKAAAKLDRPVQLDIFHEIQRKLMCLKCLWVIGSFGYIPANANRMKIYFNIKYEKWLKAKKYENTVMEKNCEWNWIYYLF